jgi:hypothetical protein
LTYGIIYEFKVEARNQFGYSEFSDTLSLLAAYIPPEPTIVRTTLADSVITVNWNLATNNGSPITAYKVYIREHGTTVYSLEATDCVGTN